MSTSIRSIAFPLTIVTFAVIAGWLAAEIDVLAVFLVASAIAMAILVQSRAWLAVAISLAPFFSRYGLELGDTVIRPEILLAIAAGASLLGDAGPSRLTEIQRVTIAAIAGWLAFLGVTTQLHAPTPGSSHAVYVWLLLDFVLMLWIVRNREQWKRIVSTSIVASVVLCIVGIPLWLLAGAGLTAWGVQRDYTYGGYAVYVTVYEANIYASLIVLWSVVAMTRFALHVPPSLRGFLIFAAPIASVAAHTRAALAAWVLAAVIAVVRTRGGQSIRAGILASVLGSTALFTLSNPFGYEGLSKFVNPFDFSGGTGEYRSNSWLVALDDIQNSGSWLFGLGLNTFGQRHVDPTKVAEQAPWYLGNVGMQILYDGGLISLVLVSCAVLGVLRASGAGDGVLIFAAYVIVGSLTSTLWLAQTWILAGLAIGLLGTARSIRCSPTPLGMRCIGLRSQRVGSFGR